MGTVLSFKPQQQEVDAAWEAYDAAQRRVMDLYRDAASTADQRRLAVIEADRLHRTFRRLIERAESVNG